MRDFPVRSPLQMAQLLVAFRKARKLTQRDLAGRLGTTQQAVSRLERDATGVSVDRLMKVLSVLGVELVFHDKEPAEGPEPKGRSRRRGVEW
jgi:HTH-type transcriptional regulator/antitoxin HipB